MINNFHPPAPGGFPAILHIKTMETIGIILLIAGVFLFFSLVVWSTKDEYLSNMFEEQDKSEKNEKRLLVFGTIILIAGWAIIASLLINAIQ